MEVQGIPEGYSVEYKNNSRSEVGQNKVEAVVYDKNHEYTFYANLKIDSRNVHRISDYSKLVSELSNFNNKTKAFDIYVLVSDIDCSETTKESPWKSIGAYAGLKIENGFQAEFDGQGHSIKNLFITGASDSVAAAGYKTPGFFAGLANASVHDIVFEAPQISVDESGIVAVGLIIGQSPVCTDIYNITVNNATVDVKATKIHCGTIIGLDQQYKEKADAKNEDEFKRENLTVSNLKMDVNNISTDNSSRTSVGGVVGEFMDRGPATYENCRVSGSITVSSSNSNVSNYGATIVGLIKGNSNSESEASVSINKCNSSLSISVGECALKNSWANVKSTETLNVDDNSVFVGNL